jgi:hypothetical protein
MTKAVYRSNEAGVSGKYSEIGSVDPNVTTYSSKNLIQTTEYFYRARAKSEPHSSYTDEVAPWVPMNSQRLRPVMSSPDRSFLG